jgi:hypothetical protein
LEGLFLFWRSARHSSTSAGNLSALCRCLTIVE